MKRGRPKKPDSALREKYTTMIKGETKLKLKELASKLSIDSNEVIELAVDFFEKYNLDTICENLTDIEEEERKGKWEEEEALDEKKFEKKYNLSSSDFDPIFKWYYYNAAVERETPYYAQKILAYVDYFETNAFISTEFNRPLSFLKQHVSTLHSQGFKDGNPKRGKKTDHSYNFLIVTLSMILNINGKKQWQDMLKLIKKYKNRNIFTPGSFGNHFPVLLPSYGKEHIEARYYDLKNKKIPLPHTLKSLIKKIKSIQKKKKTKLIS